MSVKDKLAKLIPKEVVSDLQDNLQIKLNGISKEEFNAKCKLLDRLEKQLNILEFEVNELKGNLDSKNHS